MQCNYNSPNNLFSFSFPLSVHFANFFPSLCKSGQHKTRSNTILRWHRFVIVCLFFPLFNCYYVLPSIQNRSSNKYRHTGSDLSLDSPKMRKIPQPREFQQNGFNLATPIKRNGLIGSRYAEAPLTNISSSSTSSMFTNNSSISISSGKTDTSAAAALTRSPRFQPASPRNPVLGIGCHAADSYRGRRRTERGTWAYLFCALARAQHTTVACPIHSTFDFL